MQKAGTDFLPDTQKNKRSLCANFRIKSILSMQNSKQETKSVVKIEYKIFVKSDKLCKTDKKQNYRIFFQKTS